jgi:hypothetical protein
MKTQQMWIGAAAAVFAAAGGVSWGQFPFFGDADTGSAAGVSEPGVVQPDAVKALDREDLIGKLTGAANVGGGEAAGTAGKMKQVVARMEQSSARLVENDPGAMTQEVQHRIVADLDALIELLKKQQPSGSGRGDDPSSSPGASISPGHAGHAGGDGSVAATTSQERGGEAVTPPHQIPLQERRVPDMNLPPRDRAAIITGITHGVLPEYKDQVARYYQALAELGKTSRQ